MISEPKIGISENLAGLSVGLPQDDNVAQDLLASLPCSVTAVPVESARVIPLPMPHFTFSAAELPLQAAHLNGVIIDNHTVDEHVTPEATEKTDNHTTGDKWRGLLSRGMQEKYSWLPMIESEQLSDPVLRENFIVCVTALHELNRLRAQTLTRFALIDFHSRYKLVLLAHNQPGYRKIGPFVAQIHQWTDLDKFFVVYRQQLMAILQQPASRENHVNVMMHIQGYFNRQQTAEQRRELCRVIDDYRLGYLPLSAPLAELRRLLAAHPNSYLMTQQYFNLYPDNLY